MRVLYIQPSEKEANWLGEALGRNSVSSISLLFVSSISDFDIWPHHFMGNRWGNSGNSVRLYFWGLQNH